VPAGATETINYGMPMFRYKGMVLGMPQGKRQRNQYSKIACHWPPALFGCIR